LCNIGFSQTPSDNRGGYMIKKKKKRRKELKNIKPEIAKEIGNELIWGSYLEGIR